MNDKVLFALVLALGITVPGVADFALSQLGYEGLGAIAWAAGYAGAVLLVWAVWLRPLEFDPGAGDTGYEESEGEA